MTDLRNGTIPYEPATGAYKGRINREIDGGLMKARVMASKGDHRVSSS